MMLTCFICGREIQPTETDCGPWPDDGGLWFDAKGGWPSAFFDPIRRCRPPNPGAPKWEVLRIFICDACLEKKRLELRRIEVELRTTHVEKDRGPYSVDSIRADDERRAQERDREWLRQDRARDARRRRRLEDQGGHPT